VFKYCYKIGKKEETMMKKKMSELEMKK